MKPPVGRVKLSEKAKYQMITLKRRTKIDSWNVLARWGFCRSLAEKGVPSSVPLILDSNIEMLWSVFGGEIGDILILALCQRCKNDGIELSPENLAYQFKLHLHRGVGYLAGDPSIKNIENMCFSALTRTSTPTVAPKDLVEEFKDFLENLNAD